MPEFLYWPSDLTDPKPETIFKAEFVALFDEMSESGVLVQTDCMSFFGFGRGTRRAEFIRRGNGRILEGTTLHNRETYWEVLPVSDDLLQPLGPMFGLDDCTCVVICGVADIRSFTLRWIQGMTLADSMRGILFWNRSNQVLPFELL